jgi:hypothetical protein
LGVRKLRNTCERIQHLGERKDPDNVNIAIEPEHALDLIEKHITLAEREFHEAMVAFRGFYGN